MKLTLYTYQTKEAYEKLQKEGVLRLLITDRDLTHLHQYDHYEYNYFDFPYRFMIQRMKERLPAPKYSDTYYPIWAWRKANGRYKPSKGLDRIHKGLIRLKLEIDESRLLLSDFDMFAAIISGTRQMYDDQHEDDYPGWDEVFHPTLDRIFILHRKEDDYYGPSYRKETIQATFWELFIEDVVDVKYPEEK